MIYFDHTEGRRYTLLPESVRDKGKKIIGLERLTGADLLITPLGIPSLPPTLKNTAPHRSRLAKLCEPGALIQRATGLDMLRHIKDAEQIIVRMQEWGAIPVLLSAGAYGRSKAGTVTYRRKTSKWRYSSLQGVILSWQAAGGIYVPLCHGGAMLEWVEGFEKWLVRRYNEPEKEIMVSLKPARPIIPLKEKRKDGYEIGRAVQLLASLKGIGEKHALALLEEFGTAGVALSILSSEQVLTDRMLPKGIGKLTAKGVADVLGGRMTVEGMYEAGYPVTVVFPPGFKPVTIGRKGVGWCKLEDGSTEATYFTSEQLRRSLPQKLGDSVFSKLMNHVVPNRAWAEKRMVVIGGETLVAVFDIKTGGWACTIDGELCWWNGETEKWESKADARY